MNTSLTAGMFDSIKQALVKTNTNTAYKNVLKTEPENTYTIRLLPNIADPAKTFYHYYSYSWQSLSTGQYITTLSPQTWGDRCPINEARYKMTKTGSAEDQEKAKKLSRKESWLVNVYVINDPKNPENNGTVKVLKFGKQLHTIIMEAIQDEDGDGLGERVFNLDKTGVDFKLKVVKQGDYPNYQSSKFSMPKAIDGMTPEKAVEIYKQVHDLEAIYTKRSEQELVKLLDEHFFCKPTAEKATEPAHVASVTEAIDGIDETVGGGPDQAEAELDTILAELRNEQG